jgi:hypothetical protein
METPLINTRTHTHTHTHIHEALVSFSHLPVPQIRSPLPAHAPVINPRSGASLVARSHHRLHESPLGQLERSTLIMASEAVATGSSSEGLTPAQKLMEQHGHHVTVEDVVDEEDLAHPPPSAALKSSAADAPLSEKAAGKQKADETPAPSKKAPGSASLNTASEEAFPALGPVKPRAQAAVAPTWGKKPASLAANGVNGSGAASRASTPASGPGTPASVPTSRGPALPSMALPGKHKEQIAFLNSDLKPLKELKKPIPQIIHDINKRSKARLERKESPNGVIFEATGPAPAVRQSLLEIANEVLAKVCPLAHHHFTIAETA